MISLVLALFLGARPTPFPPPQKAFVSDDLKYDSGAVSSVDAEHQKFQLTVPIGTATFQVESSTAYVNLSKDGSEFSLSTLKVGQKVRVYYRVKEGAKVAEIDLQ